LVTLAGQLRRLAGYDLEEGVSTRLLVYAAKLMAAGMAPRLACRTALVEPLSDDADTLAALSAIVATQFGA
jgi:nitric oxide reductase NorQ protein